MVSKHKVVLLVHIQHEWHLKGHYLDKYIPKRKFFQATLHNI